MGKNAIFADMSAQDTILVCSQSKPNDSKMKIQKKSVLITYRAKNENRSFQILALIRQKYHANLESKPFKSCESIKGCFIFIASTRIQKEISQEPSRLYLLPHGDIDKCHYVRI